jgi:hypothetical protein
LFSACPFAKPHPAAPGLAQSLGPRIKCGIVTAWFNERRNKVVIPDPHYSCFLETNKEHAFFRGWLTSSLTGLWSV